MIMQKHDGSRREAVIWDPHGNHTKQHAFTMATELVREFRGDSIRAGAGLWLFEELHAWQQQNSIGSH